MKQQKWRVLLSLLLAMCFCLSAFAPVYAADGLWGGFGQSPDGSLSESLSDSWKKLWDRLFGGDNGTQDDSGVETLQYRIVHLDCGREYFNKDWIIALINEMAAAGYNQLQLAFGNGGFRFYLDDMAVKGYPSYAVKAAIEAGNEHYNTYGDDENGPNNTEWIEYKPSVNALTESEMNEIISYAQTKSIEIVPMFNTPGHMHALLAAMQELGMTNVSVKNGCMNLDSEDAVSFAKALVEKYVEYFKNKGCNYFHLATDEYSSFNPAFYNYANSLVNIVVAHEVTPRIFNDSFRTGSSTYIKKDSSYPTQVCYWYNGNGSDSANVVNNAGYSLINTNHDYYYVSTNEHWNLYREGYTFVGDYNESTWKKKAEEFDNKVFHGTNINSPAGSMFAIWCNTPGKNSETEIAKQIRMILRVLGARMQDSYKYSDSSVIVEGGFNEDGSINGSTPVEPEPDPVIQDGDGNKGIFEIIINAILRIFLPEGTTATWTVTQGADVVELISDNAAAAQALNTQAAAIRGNSVQVKALKAGTATITATLDNGKTVNATVTVQDSKEQTITVTVGGEYKVTVDGNHAGTYATDIPEIASVTAVHQQSSGLGAGTFYISSVANDSNPTTEITFESAENGTYYIKNSNGLYIYPNASLSIGGWNYFLGTATSYDSAQTVTIKEENGAIVVSRSVSSGWYNTTTYLTLNNSTFGASVTRTNLYLYGIDQTVLTFTGHKVGTTTVVIGGVTYTINVVKEDLSKVTLPVNLWITNTGVVPTGWSNGTPSEFTYSDTDGNRRSIYTLKANYPSVNTADGIALSSILPANSGTAKSWDGNTYDVVYWKSAYHTAENRQSTDGGRTTLTWEPRLLTFVIGMAAGHIRLTELNG